MFRKWPIRQGEESHSILFSSSFKYWQEQFNVGNFLDY